MKPQDPYAIARRHVERKLGLYIHLAVFLTVNTGLFLFNLLAVPERMWSVFPLFGWGIGLLFHALSVYLAVPGAQWKARMIEKEMNKLR